MIPKEIFPTSIEIKKNMEFYRKKILTYKGQKIIFDQDIRKGECYFCKKYGWYKRSTRTFLHHVLYDDSNPILWTIEVCGSCHYWIDKNNRRIIDAHFYTRQQQYWNPLQNKLG